MAKYTDGTHASGDRFLEDVAGVVTLDFMVGGGMGMIGYKLLFNFSIGTPEQNRTAI